MRCQGEASKRPTRSQRAADRQPRGGQSRGPAAAKGEPRAIALRDRLAGERRPADRTTLHQTRLCAPRHLRQRWTARGDVDTSPGGNGHERGAATARLVGGAAARRTSPPRALWSRRSGARRTTPARAMTASRPWASTPAAPCARWRTSRRPIRPSSPSTLALAVTAKTGGNGALGAWLWFGAPRGLPAALSASACHGFARSPGAVSLVGLILMLIRLLGAG